MIITVTKPRGTTSILNGQSSGIHPNPCGEIFLRYPVMTKPKYSFSRNKWYEALWPDFTANKPGLDGKRDPVRSWCITHFGPSHSDAWARWTPCVGHIKFRDEADYMLFLLKWSS